MKNHFKLLSFLIFSCIIIFSCQKNIDNEIVLQDTVIEEIKYRYDDADQKETEETEECHSTGNQEQTLDLTGKSLYVKKGESMEDFLTRLGYTMNLCEGSCEGDKKCKIVTISSSNKDDIHFRADPDGNITRIKLDPGVDITSVKLRLKATCDCL